MNLEEWIPVQAICTHYHVEITFINSLKESGIIEVTTVEEKTYVRSEHMGEFEKMRRLHYDLNINLEGLEAIRSLLDNVQKLQQKNRELSNRLKLYE